MKAVLRLSFWIVLVAVGWVLGGKVPPPAVVMNAVDAAGARVAGLARQGLGRAGEEASRSSDAARRRAADALAPEADAPKTDDSDTAPPDPETPAAAPAPPRPAPRPSAPAPSGSFTPDARMAVCGGFDAQNTSADADGYSRRYKPYVASGDVVLILAPVNGACLASGFGERDGKLHKGVDYNADDNIPVVAGGSGVVLEQGYRDDYGETVLIAHGGGVYTRYAHLQGVAPGVRAGAPISAGDLLGRMGDTAAYEIPVHLHYEVLTGEYDTPEKSFGLTPIDPYALPSAR